MKTFLTGAVAITFFALAVPAMAASGQCSFTGYDSFACDVSADGGGITFALPDGQLFVFAHVENGSGIGYLAPSDAEPGRSPRQLGEFDPALDQPGCWADADDDIEFCAATSQ